MYRESLDWNGATFCYCNLLQVYIPDDLLVYIFVNLMLISKMFLVDFDGQM